ncbi:M-phase inducer phosphatase 1-B isoform X1 [Papilio machaon]|uniref:M-phase inducer phosphatase 1-B isoform X1 n=1 Tax=Papilio machaon TaxID=76193 RepID=UPI001E66571B|nr:M-phase inducer phosphatase 1-B isoform X1 [Papilio machaon]
MWGESSKNCEMNCQCSGLITENFKINSGNSGKKRKQSESLSANFKLKMNPHSLDFNTKQSPHSSPIATPKRRVLGELQNSPLYRPMNSPIIERITSPTIERLKSSPLERKSPLIDRTLSPLTSRTDRVKRSSAKITRMFEERTKFKMSNKENQSPLMSETFMKLDMEEETRDCSFGETFQSLTCTEKVNNWSTVKFDFTDALPQKSYENKLNDIYVPEKDIEPDLDTGFETLHDLEEEFEADNFDQCSKYEIISTDSPDIISKGRSSTRKISSKDFVFGAPLADNEASTSFNKPNVNATRMLNFEDEPFEFTSPATKRSTISVKKSLKFNETPTKSDNTCSSSPCTKVRFPSESTASMESGFVSEFEEPFLELDDISNSPKMPNFNELLSGTIKENIIINTEYQKKPIINRSMSLNSKARVSLFSISESPVNKSQKRTEVNELENGCNKRRKSNCGSPQIERQRPVLQRAYSENNASIMSALARSVLEPDLIGDFSLPFALPLTNGDHADLKSISCDTLAALLRGEFHTSISQYQVIDCRYPYEFDGGHILGAVNLYTPEQILTLVNEPLPKSGDKRSILIFHCEFSLERGPKLSRFLRSNDRAKNQENYPSLHYPEIYLLHEGYRAFYKRYPALCSAGYTAMLDPNHRHQLRQHRALSLPAAAVHRRHRHN